MITVTPYNAIDAVVKNTKLAGIARIDDLRKQLCVLEAIHAPATKIAALGRNAYDILANQEIITLCGQRGVHLCRASAAAMRAGSRSFRVDDTPAISSWLRISMRRHAFIAISRTQDKISIATFS